MKNKSNFYRVGCAVAIFFILFTACKKDNYYIDGGKSDPYFKGNILEYLQSSSFYFDTLVQVIKLADMEATFKTDTITFFAPPDLSIQRLMIRLNQRLFTAGKDTVLVLNDIPKEIWAKYLKMYLYKGGNTLKDYPQLDLSLKNRYGGQNYISYSGTVFNIGGIFSDVGGVKYVGYRQLAISFIPNTAQPFDNWVTAYVASSDIQPYNGVVHVLNGNTHNFSFDTENFIQEVLLIK